MVVLSNESREKGVVCADAVRFGGGMGNIVRGGQVSGLPRYLEARVIPPNGPVCPTPYMPDTKDRTTFRMISMYVRVQSTTYRAVQYSTPKNRDWEFLLR